ncbi:hypothetical protein AAC387_Pa03g2778 [Persea americana]
MVNQDPVSLLTSSQDLFSSQRDVTYSCGACGYALNLSSSNRNTANIGSKYNKAIKKGVIPFFYIDESRFTQVDELNCVPHFISKHSWGLFRPRTKLLCRKCGNHIGHAYEEITFPLGSENSDSNSSNGASVCRKFNVRIRALQPSSEDSGIPFVV